MDPPESTYPTAPKPGGPDAAPVARTLQTCNTRTCYHPIDLTSSIDKDKQDFGLLANVDWKSPTGSLSSLSTYVITEYLEYSTIRWPPFGDVMGPPRISGTTERRPPDRKDWAQGSAGHMRDWHRHPRQQCSNPPVEDAYEVAQSYDFNCSACMASDTWEAIAHYRIRYSIFQHNGRWMFQTEKIGPGGPLVSLENF